MKLPTINYDQARQMDWCWWADPEKSEQLQRYAERKAEWTALDILNLPDSEVSSSDKLCAVLRIELIPEEILHSLACDFAEHALSYAKNPDPRSVAAIQAKRDWLDGKITDSDLASVRYAAAWAAAARAAGHAEWAAEHTAWAAERAAAAWAAGHAEWDAERAAERRWHGVMSNKGVRDPERKTTQ